MSDHQIRAEPLTDVIRRRWSRRHVLQHGAVLPLILHLDASRAQAEPATAPARTLSVAPGLGAMPVLRFGDAMWPGDPGFSPKALRTMDWLTPDAVEQQTRRFGDSCDAIAYFRAVHDREDLGIVCVNHEYVDPDLVFAGFSSPSVWMRKYPLTVPWMQAAHGVSIVCLRRDASRWHAVLGHPLTRRITANTPCDIRGPARGSDLLQSRRDPRGQLARGTFGNCAGGKTPWGTYLTAEENVQDYFGTADSRRRGSVDPLTSAALARWPLKEHSLYGWEQVDPRFDLRAEPREALRHGWIVEIDPFDPTSRPVKRTALGRFCHEGASPVLARDGRVAVYMGDDSKWEYVYKFVSRDRFSPDIPSANKQLLDHGVLHVARFDANGRGAWLPLRHDERGPLNTKAGFRNQADVVIKCRAAADLLGATPMDRPEDIEPHPVTGRVYLSCTKNADRWGAGPGGSKAPDAANPRAQNEYGHVIEIAEQDADAASLEFSWNIVLLAGDPAKGRITTDPAGLQAGKPQRTDSYVAGNGGKAALAAIACPDNLGFDARGNLWIATDAEDHLIPNNGCYRVTLQGADLGRLERMVAAPIGAEVCGVEFTPDGRTLFLSIQHPGEGGTPQEPLCDWPDGEGSPPRSTVIAVMRDDAQPL